MSAQWLAQLPGCVLAIAGEVHATSHEAGRLADTKHPGWRPVGRYEADRLASAKQSAQQLASCPATHPRSIRLNYRATAENQPGSVRATSCVASRESSTQYQMNHPGACQATVERCPGNVHAIATLKSARRQRNIHKLDSPCPYPVRDHDRSLSVSAHSLRG